MTATLALSFLLIPLTLLLLYTMSFNPEEFLSATITQANDTRVTPVPIGEYQGIIDKVSARQWQSKDGTKSGIALDVIWLVEDSGVKQLLGRETVTVKQGIMLDLNPQGGIDLSPGKNVGLGRLREAVGKNDEGSPFSFAQLAGMAAKIGVTHRIAGEDTFAEVKSVARL